MSKEEFKTVGKNIFEFRYDPIISFYNWKGSLAEHLIDKLGFNGFRIADNRIEVTNADRLDFIVFVGIQNAGVLIENNYDPKEIKEKISVFIKALSEFEKFKPKKIIRLGVRWSFLKHKKSTSFDDVKKAFEENIIQFNKTPYNEFKETLTDVGLPLNFEGVKFNYNITHGPMKQAQALTMFYKNKTVYFDNLGQPNNIVPKSGFFFDIDVFKEGLEIVSLDDTEKCANEFVDVGIDKFNIIANELFSKIQ